MEKTPIQIYSLKDPRQQVQEREYWRTRPAEERVSAVEVLRCQFGKLAPGKGYDSSQRLRRILRIVQ